MIPLEWLDLSHAGLADEGEESPAGTTSRAVRQRRTYQPG
jgi:hypothetical protein